MKGNGRQKWLQTCSLNASSLREFLYKLRVKAAQASQQLLHNFVLGHNAKSAEKGSLNPKCKLSHDAIYSLVIHHVLLNMQL